MRKKAFTLAEVLITLTIIGIIAAMTVPTLMNKVQDHGFRSAFLKNYAMIKNVEKLAFQQEGEKFFSSGPNSYYTEDILKKYFKIEGDVITKKGGDGYGAIASAYMGQNLNTAWFNENIKCLNGTNCFRGNCNATAFKTADGSIIAFMTADYWPALVYMDVNGVHKPNKAGKDIFLLEAHHADIVPVGIYKNGNGGIVGGFDTCKMNSTGLSCGAEILKNRSFKIPKE